MKGATLLGALLLLTGCALADSRSAQYAKMNFVGMSEVDLQSCLGAPDNHSTFGAVDVLTYKGNSTSSGGVNITLPIIGGGFSVSGGGYCNATFKVEHGRVTGLRYNGETDATAAPDAYCAPIVRRCLYDPPSSGG